MALLGNIFKKNRISTELIIRDLIEFTVNTFKQDRASFTTAGAYGQIIFVLDQLSQLILYYIEDSITELNINTATRASSVYGLAALAGHNPTRAIAATGSITLIPKNVGLQDIPGGVVVIPNQTSVKCINNGIDYILDLPADEIRIPLDGSKNGLALNIIQGRIESTSFTGAGTPLQSFTANFSQGVLIDNFKVFVFVNGEKWKKYDGFLDMPRDAKGYLIHTSVTGGIDIFFGNSFFGLMPPLGADILVEYLVTQGETGNLRLSDGESAIYKWNDTGFTTFGDDVDLNENFQTNDAGAPDFGTNAEPLALTRLIAPKVSRSFVLANSDSYIIFLEKFNLFSVIDAFTNSNTTNTTNSTNPADDNVIFLFLIPDVRKTLKSNENYFNVDESRFLLTSLQENKILGLIEESGSKVLTTVVQIVGPSVSRYVVNVALIIFDGYNEDSIKQTIVTRLSDYFLTVRRRDRIPRSDLISIIEAVPGVDSVNVSILSQKDEESFVADPTSVPTGIDEFGDVIIQAKELVIIRGGWSDRRGIAYVAGINPEKPSACNIQIRDVVPVTYNTGVNNQNKTTIKQ